MRYERKVDPKGLCDLRHRIVNLGLGPLAIAAIAARHDGLGGGFRTRSLIMGRTLDAGATLDLDARPPRNISHTLHQGLVVMALPHTGPEARIRLRQAITSLTAANSTESWSRTIAAIGQREIFIRRAREIFRPGWVDTRKTSQTLP